MLSDNSQDDRKEHMNDIRNTVECAVILTTTIVSRTSLSLVVANQAVILQTLLVLEEQCQVFGWIVCLGHTHQLHCRLLNISPGGYDDRVTQRYPQSGQAQMWILHMVINRLYISTEDIYNMLHIRNDETQRWESGSVCGAGMEHC